MDLFSTHVLAGVVANLKRSQSFLLDRYFPQEQRETSEEIHFDVANGRRRIAPFVSPLVGGKVMKGEGFSTKTFKPAYIKDKRVFQPNKALKRSIGEQIGGQLTPEERLMINLRTELADQVSMITRGMEVMAGQALFAGKVIVSGENYPTTVVDFQRDAALRVVLAGADKWSDPNCNPLDDLQDWSMLVLQKSGAMPTEVTMTTDVWKVFRNNPHVEKRWNSHNIGLQQLRPDAQKSVGGVYMGTIDGFDIYSYADWYVDPADDAEKPILPEGTVLMAGPQVEGVRAFGAILDEEAGLQALPYFPKSWVNKDPSVRYLLTQSAPLVVPYRVNSTLSATVL